MIPPIKHNSIPGVCELSLKVLEDERGRFVKTFHQDLFIKHGLETRFTEEYYTLSHQGVLRGLHFQTPPHDHTKIVYCVSGQVFDVVVDLRIGSPTYGKHEVLELSSKKASLLYIPPGLAHGFYVTSPHATLIYKVTTEYSKEHDSGILWNSVGIQWPNEKPLISKRDSGFVSLDQFKSPFTFNKEIR